DAGPRPNRLSLQPSNQTRHAAPPNRACDQRNEPLSQSSISRAHPDQSKDEYPSPPSSCELSPRVPFQPLAQQSRRISLTSISISRRVPIPIRTNPGAIDLLRSRNKIPFFSSRANNAGPLPPKSTNKKFPALGNGLAPNLHSSRVNHSRVRRISRMCARIVF